jgi:hypothetical protein
LERLSLPVPNGQIPGTSVIINNPDVLEGEWK